MKDRLKEEQWAGFKEEGFVRLGKVPADEIAGLQQRIDEIMLGEADIDYDRVMMQLDRSDGPDSKPGPQSMGHKGRTLTYRKIEELELDPLFLSYLQKPLFRHICARAYGDDTPVASYRAMFMNKPSGLGSHLTWHQDRWQWLDRDPMITVYTGLDPATVDNGCLQVIPGSHRILINPDHAAGFLSQEQAQELVSENESIYLELEAGEVVLLHNWLAHSSDVNRTRQSRRAFSVCYMDAATKVTSGRTFPIVFEQGAVAA